MYMRMPTLKYTKILFRFVVVAMIKNTILYSIPILKPFLQLHIEFRPESYDGIILLTGERDDLTGDFMAVLIHQGFIEFW